MRRLAKITPHVPIPQLLHWIFTTDSMHCRITSIMGCPPQWGQGFSRILSNSPIDPAPHQEQ
jgi:hypothetical protein